MILHWNTVHLIGTIRSAPQPTTDKHDAFFVLVDNKVQLNIKAITAERFTIPVLFTRKADVKFIVATKAIRRGADVFVQGSLIMTSLMGHAQLAVACSTIRYLTEGPLPIMSGRNPEGWKDILEQKVKSVVALERAERSEA